MSHYNRIFASLVISVFAQVAIPVWAIDADYLKMLEAEAEQVQLDDSGQLKQDADEQSAITTFEWDGSVSQEGFPGKLSQKDFEAFLHQYYYGTFVFFKKLDAVDKDTVYLRYMKESAPSIENVRQNVMSLFKR